MSEVDAGPRLRSFIVCDDVRPELLGKFQLLGWFPGGGITIHKNSAIEGAWEPVLQTLAIVFVLEGGNGSYPAGFALESPSGVPIATINMPSISLLPDGVSTVICKGGPIKIPEFGRYVARLKFGTWEFAGEIELKLGEPVKDPFKGSAQP
ncbi:MAG: hypothetical protein IPG49_02695 [Proteobacteria bacterium]|jgi:hypothetical protein|nr:hypothetical protein [Pseudomonadota bacterium]